MPPRSSAATITRTAALRALKQQRSATPERRDSDQPPQQLQPQPPQQPMPAATQRAVSDGGGQMAGHAAPDGGHPVRTAGGGVKETGAAAGQVVPGQGVAGEHAVEGKGASREQQQERAQENPTAGADAPLTAAVKATSPAPRPSPVHPAMPLSRSLAPQRPDVPTHTAPCTHPGVALDLSDSFSNSKEQAVTVDATRQQPTSSASSSGASSPPGSDQASKQHGDVQPQSSSQPTVSDGEAGQPGACGAVGEGEGLTAQPGPVAVTEASYMPGPLHASLFAAYTRGAGVPQAHATARVSPTRVEGSVPARAGATQPAVVAGQRQRACPQQQQRSPQPRSRTPSQAGRTAAGRSAGGAAPSLPAALRPASPPPAAPTAAQAHGPMGQGAGAAAAGAQPHAHTPGWMEDVLMVAKARAQRLEEQVGCVVCFQLARRLDTRVRGRNGPGGPFNPLTVSALIAVARTWTEDESVTVPIAWITARVAAKSNCGFAVAYAGP